MALSPVMVAFLAFLPPRGERPGWVALAGMTVGLSGLLLAVTERRGPGGRPRIHRRASSAAAMRTRCACLRAA